MKKILYLSDVDISSSGGAQESMRILMKELEEEYEFFLISPKGRKIHKNHIVLQEYNDFILRGKKFFTLLKMARDILNKIKKVNPNIIHVQMPSTLILVNLLFSLKLLNKSINKIYTDRGVYGKYGKVTTKSINSFIKKSDKVIVTTYKNKNNYKNLYNEFHKYKHKFKLIYNTGGKDYSKYEPGLRNKMRKKLKLLEGDFVIGFCGRFNEQKNWPLSKEIMGKFKNYQNVKFIVVIGTDGSNMNLKDTKKFLQQLNEDLGESKISSFIDLTNSELNDLYYAMDCFVLTSKWESFGRTAVEAMSRKNIVLGTNVDGIPEVIGRSDCIYNCVEQAFEKIDYFINNRKELESAKNYFYKRYNSLFCYTINVKEYKNLYKEILTN